jgi:hypothetical protein
MEKRRRARINNCLNELKTLILDAMKKDVSIVEMTGTRGALDGEINGIMEIGNGNLRL